MLLSVACFETEEVLGTRDVIVEHTDDRVEHLGADLQVNVPILLVGEARALPVYLFDEVFY
jgi:hypothetical protein